MAKRKHPESATPAELLELKLKDTVANHATRSEKTAWQRQHDNLTKLVRKLEPIEDKMLALITEKTKIIDELMVLRSEMVQSCVHPFEHLIVHDHAVVCKFCEKRMVVQVNESTESDETESSK